MKTKKYSVIAVALGVMLSAVNPVSAVEVKDWGNVIKGAGTVMKFLKKDNNNKEQFEELGRKVEVLQKTNERVEHLIEIQTLESSRTALIRAAIRGNIKLKDTEAFDRLR